MAAAIVRLPVATLVLDGKVVVFAAQLSRGPRWAVDSVKSKSTVAFC